jgi:membrane fusion protein, copper/silver efflux system
MTDLRHHVRLLRVALYVESDRGVFEEHEVVLGPRSGDRFPVLDGLAAGEEVAAAGAFLIDAESRLNPAFGGTTTSRESATVAHEHPK